MAPKSKKLKGKGSTKCDGDQWVCITPESSLDSIDGCPDPTFVKLRHPKTENGAMFLFSSDGTGVYEVMRFKRDFGSWFINDSIQQDGSLEVITPVDPVFLALPYLVKSNQERNKFMTLDQIVLDDDYPQCIKLLHCSGMSDIERVAEVKGSGDVRAFRYDKSKTLDWLRDKVQQTAARLGQTDIHVTSGAQSTTFVRSSKEQGATGEDYQRYAAGLVSDYLSPDLSKQMFDHIGIKEVSEKVAKVIENGAEPPMKKARISSDAKTEPEEDYSKAFTGSNDTKKEKNGKMTAAQKALSKVDKKGMKSISSFFSPKPKK
ncbi:ribonuclease H2 subunit B-like [Lytechinus variegatus]|uniref:ribonuclease H2 subunit B-like n=1 Tax=Lytechinus variegatus TaxID=7654 RepID=UPI001BB15B49|nr:ribonuclease H2 subunit B-like [Lytechinus variegatus]